MRYLDQVAGIVRARGKRTMMCITTDFISCNLSVINQLIPLDSIPSPSQYRYDVDDMGRDGWICNLLYIGLF